MQRRCTAAIAAMAMMAAVAAGAEDKKWRVEVEAGPVWQSRNDVRIPNKGGTRFSLVGVSGIGPEAFTRIYLSRDVDTHHRIRMLYAPLTIRGEGTLGQTTQFAGQTFASGTSTQSEYRFNSYRITYASRWRGGGRWQWWGGITLKVRDARIALRQGSIASADDDLGVVPLGHLFGEGRLGGRWTATVDLDASAAPQGRAIDLALKLGYDLTDDWRLTAGYRTLEGGADVDRVYTFAWLNYLVLGAQRRF